MSAPYRMTNHFVAECPPFESLPKELQEQYKQSHGWGDYWKGYSYYGYNGCLAGMNSLLAAGKSETLTSLGVLAPMPTAGDMRAGYTVEALHRYVDLIRRIGMNVDLVPYEKSALGHPDLRKYYQNYPGPVHDERRVQSKDYPFVFRVFVEGNTALKRSVAIQWARYPHTWGNVAVFETFLRWARDDDSPRTLMNKMMIASCIAMHDPYRATDTEACCWHGTLNKQSFEAMMKDTTACISGRTRAAMPHLQGADTHDPGFYVHTSVGMASSYASARHRSKLWPGITDLTKRQATYEEVITFLMEQGCTATSPFTSKGKDGFTLSYALND